MIYHQNRPALDSPWGDPYTLEDLDAECRLAVKNLKPRLDEFDVIVATGLSGIIPAAPLSLKLRKPLAILRKPDDNTHQMGGLRYSVDGSYWVGGTCVKDKRALWIDDFSCSGDTEKRICKAVKELGGRVVLAYMTQPHEFMDVSY